MGGGEEAGEEEREEVGGENNPGNLCSLEMVAFDFPRSQSPPSYPLLIVHLSSGDITPLSSPLQGRASWTTQSAEVLPICLSARTGRMGQGGACPQPRFPIS